MSERIWTRNPDAQEQERSMQNGRQEAEIEQEEAGGDMPQCPEYGGHVVTDDEHGETVCNDCGLVVTAGSVNHDPEWRAFDACKKDEKSRVGAPTTNTTHSKGLSINIGWRGHNACGNPLGVRQRRKMQWSREWSERFRTHDSKERSLKQALGEIDRMTSALGLPEDVRETAPVVYRRALNDDLLPGRPVEGVATSCTYATVRIAGVPRSLDEIVEAPHVEKSEVTRIYRYIVREPSLEVKPVDPEQYIPRSASEFGLSDESKVRTCQFLKNVKEKSVHLGKPPVGLTVAAVYAAVLLISEKTAQTAISDVADISEVIARNCHHEPLETEENLGLV